MSTRSITTRRRYLTQQSDETLLIELNDCIVSMDMNDTDDQLDEALLMSNKCLIIQNELLRRKLTKLLGT